MWLPVGNSFHHNETVANISAGKYHNIRLMAGNSGHCPGQGVGPTGVNLCQWMTASQSIVVGAKSGRGAAPEPPLFSFGAACVRLPPTPSQLIARAGVESCCFVRRRRETVVLCCKAF